MLSGTRGAISIHVCSPVVDYRGIETSCVCMWVIGMKNKFYFYGKEVYASMKFIFRYIYIFLITECLCQYEESFFFFEKEHY